MANEITTAYATGNTLYATIRDEDLDVAYIAGETFEEHGTSSRTNSDYSIALTEDSVGYYAADYPSWIERGTYETIIYLQAGSSPADSDTPVAGPTEKYWTGTAVVEAPETNAVHICNRALAKLGGGGDNTLTIDALGDGTDTGDLCDLLYTAVRREVLKRMKPQECSYYADLGDESSTTAEKAEWEYVFDLPSDNLIVVRQTDEEYHKIDYPYQIKQSYLFTNILSNTDRDSAYIEYIKNETDGDSFSDEVIEAMATLLASRLAPRIVKGDKGWQVSGDLLNLYETLVLPTSMGINQSQQFHQEEPRETKFSWLADRPFDYEDFD